MAHVHDGESELPATIGRTFAIGIALNVGFVIIEGLYGWRAGSLALLADAFHNLSDVGGLLLAWAGLAAAAPRAQRSPYLWMATRLHPRELRQCRPAAGGHGLARVGGRASSAEPGGRLDGWTVVVVAAIGVVVNAATAALFFRGRKGDLNIRAAFLHMAADALVSVGVVAAGAIYLWRSWTWVDPVVSLIVAAVLLPGTWSLFRDSLHLLFDGVPREVSTCATCARPCSPSRACRDCTNSTCGGWPPPRRRLPPTSWSGLHRHDRDLLLRSRHTCWRTASRSDM